eukprot:g4457.t1
MRTFFKMSSAAVLSTPPPHGAPTRGRLSPASLVKFGRMYSAARARGKGRHWRAGAGALRVGSRVQQKFVGHGEWAGVVTGVGGRGASVTWADGSSSTMGLDAALVALQAHGNAPDPVDTYIGKLEQALQRRLRARRTYRGRAAAPAPEPVGALAQLLPCHGSIVRAADKLSAAGWPAAAAALARHCELDLDTVIARNGQLRRRGTEEEGISGCSSQGIIVAEAAGGGSSSGKGEGSSSSEDSEEARIIVAETTDGGSSSEFEFSDASDVARLL